MFQQFVVLSHPFSAGQPNCILGPSSRHSLQVARGREGLGAAARHWGGLSLRGGRFLFRCNVLNP